ncbi:MAG: AAA family ATPase [bacterium]|nr:AAA family ATPase [bacterium]
MLTQLTVRNFKRFADVEVELGSPVVFVGPNNSGKTSAMQALALWDAGLRGWRARYPDQTEAGKRPGVAINRRDLVSVPVPSARFLWRALDVRNIQRVHGTLKTSNVRIDVVVNGTYRSRPWRCGMEFDYANEESVYCRPLRVDENATRRMSVPEEAGTAPIAFLPPMSGLATHETYVGDGALSGLIGQGRTAEVLRNLCLRVYQQNPHQWETLVGHIEGLFGVTLDAPNHFLASDELVMTYREHGIALDLSSSGRGFHQTLLILAYMYANPGAVLLLDEPDAHLEVLRQREIYRLMADVASHTGSQIIVASHSEVLLAEAVDRHLVVAFVGAPHRVDDRGSEVHKALREIGFEHYFQAEQTGWVLFLEGSTDLAILQAFARRLGHERAIRALERPYVHYVANQPDIAWRHFAGLREALPELRGMRVFDRLSRDLQGNGLRMVMWKRREIESYLCTRETLEQFVKVTAAGDALGPLFVESEIQTRLSALRESIEDVRSAMSILEQGSPWDQDTKVSDVFLKPLFRAYFQKLGLPNLMNKKSFYELAEYVPSDEIDPEIVETLDAIAEIAESAQRAS